MTPSKKSKGAAQSKLARIVARLKSLYGPIAPPAASSAFALILWEKVAYLANDAKRLAAFRALEQRVGLTPRDILAAPRADLEAICALGGSVSVAGRAGSIHDSAALVFDEFDGDLDGVLTRPIAEAKRALMRFYGVGEPGAERILLLTHSQKVLPLDSNGARTMVRLGYGVADDKNYTRMYRSVGEAARPELVDEFPWLVDAHVYLRHHGQKVCKASAPRCDACAIRSECSFGSRLKFKQNARL